MLGKSEQSLTGMLKKFHDKTGRSNLNCVSNRLSQQRGSLKLTRQCCTLVTMYCTGIEMDLIISILEIKCTFGLQ